MFQSSLVPLFLPYLVAAQQDFTVPALWRGSTITTPFSGIREIVELVAESLTQVADPESGNPIAMRALATSDHLLGSELYLPRVVAALQATIPFLADDELLSCSDYSSFRTAWGLAALDAYNTYGSEFAEGLNYSVTVWNEVLPYQIQLEDAENKHFPLKNLSLPSQCNGTSLAGGVFTTNVTANNQIDALSQGGFLALSARLYDIFGEPKYADAASLAASFLQSQLYNNTVLLDSIDPTDCTITNTTDSFSQGWAIEGLSVFGTTNSTFSTFLRDLISTTVPFPGWTASDGIITEGNGDASTGDDTLKSVFIRGLYEAWMRMNASDPAANFTKSYIAVQFNALQDLAGTSSHIYSSQWTGPPPSQASLDGQAEALDVLNAALAITIPDQTSAPRKSRSKTPIIVGAVIGGVIFIVLALAAVLFWRRRRHIRESYVRTVMEATAVPFMDERMSTDAPLMSERKGGGVITADRPREPQEGTGGSTEESSTQQGAVANINMPSARTDENEVEDLTAVPALLNRLNRILARLPPGGVDDEDPPEYQG
ncbi:hypothetical protein NM688_g7968 [Phlebia brevispora]|uniref:Uncharacterized protein n=1 Tax=Phlebia brevispora TaxID=194682 RepID=A0ACC1RZ79_9APHY|nr:hypothetical protein NM688_g7968 [Phlebia brevispora]